jgi:hypothetical protein
VAPMGPILDPRAPNRYQKDVPEGSKAEATQNINDFTWFCSTPGQHEKTCPSQTRQTRQPGKPIVPQSTPITCIWDPGLANKLQEWLEGWASKVACLGYMVLGLGYEVWVPKSREAALKL